MPGFNLGGWVNPHQDAARQVDFLLAQDFEAEFFLTQVVSHHHLGAVDRQVADLVDHHEAREDQGPQPAHEMPGPLCRFEPGDQIGEGHPFELTESV